MSAHSLQLRLNPLTGDSEWIVINERDDENQTEEQIKSRNLLANTSYLDMINDSRRNFAFRTAIEAAVTRPCHVIDIGAGTGLLSMMSARAMEKFGGQTGGGRVSACDSYLPMVKLMKKVLRANGMQNKIKLFPKRSDELRVGVELDSPADILVSEILDSELLGEGLIPTLQHAHEKLLVPNALTIPYRATTFGQLVESTYLWNLNDLHSQELDASDGISLSPFVSIKPKQYAMHCDSLSKEIRLLSEPFKIFEFDFWKRPESSRETEIKIKVTDDGKIHAIISWWVLQLDESGSIFYSTAPDWVTSNCNSNLTSGEKVWCDHWKQCVWFSQQTRFPVLKDNYISLGATHSDTSISYQLNPELCTSSSTGTEGLEESLLFLSPERLGLYGDKDWRSALITSVRNALNVRPSSPLCVVADDSLFLTVAIYSLSNSSHVIASFPGLREKANYFIKTIADDSNGFSMDRLKVIGRKVLNLIAEDEIKGRKVDILVGEPFYHGNEGMLPWQNLRFWRERTMLDPVLAQDALIMPCKGILKICAVSLPDLWRSRCSLKEVEGFGHSMVNETLGACGALNEMHQGPCLPYYLWQSGKFEKLSKVYSLMDFNFSEPIHSCFGKLKIEFCKEGICHGFTLWIDWVMDEKNSIVVCTGPDRRYWKQGVQLISKPVLVKNFVDSYAEIDADFDHLTGEITLKSSFSSS